MSLWPDDGIRWRLHAKRDEGRTSLGALPAPAISS